MPTITASRGSIRRRTRPCRRSRSAAGRPALRSAAASSGSRTASTGRSRRSTRTDERRRRRRRSGRERADRGRLRRRARLGRELERPDADADRPALGHAAEPDSGRRGRGRGRGRGGVVWVTSESSGTASPGSTPGPGRVLADDQRRQRRRARSPSAPERSGSRTASTGPSPGSTRRTNTVARRFRSATARAVSRSRGDDGLGQQRARRHALADRPGPERGRRDRQDREPAGRGRPRPRTRSTSPSGRPGLAHRGGTLTVLETEPPRLDRPGPRLRPRSGTAMILTNDGLIGYRRVGGSDGARLVPDLATSLPTPTDGGRTYTFQLRPGIRYSTGALVRPADFRRAIERALSSSPATRLLLQRHRRRRRVPEDPEALRSLAGDRRRLRPRTRSPST